MGIGATYWRRREGEAGMATTSSPQLLPGVRVLDLTDDKGLLAGKLLADMGADVILVEPPVGNPARHLGPFYKDQPGSETSLSWFGGYVDNPCSTPYPPRETVAYGKGERYGEALCHPSVPRIPTA